MRSTPVWPIEVAIAPRTGGDAGRLADALGQTAAQDCRFGCSVDPGSGETVAKVGDDRDIDLLIDILWRTFRLKVMVGAPQVAYRETVARATEVSHTHAKQLAGSGSFARVTLRLEPSETGAGNAFLSEIVGGAVPEAYIPGVEAGVQSVWDAGVLIGFPIIDTTVTLLDGTWHELDSSTTAFEIAARAAMRAGATQAGMRLLEPVMEVEVTAPRDLVGGVIRDLEARRGRVDGCWATLGPTSVLRGYVSTARLLGYRSELGALTEGLGTYAMRFSHYAEAQPCNGPGPFRPAMAMRA